MNHLTCRQLASRCFVRPVIGSTVSARRHVAVQAILQDRSRGGPVRYRVCLVTPAGERPLPDLDVTLCPVGNRRGDR
jgi:hypothetical protein